MARYGAARGESLRHAAFVRALPRHPRAQINRGVMATAAERTSRRPGPGHRPRGARRERRSISVSGNFTGGHRSGSGKCCALDGARAERSRAIREPRRPAEGTRVRIGATQLARLDRPVRGCCRTLRCRSSASGSELIARASQTRNTVQSPIGWDDTGLDAWQHIRAIVEHSADRPRLID